MMKKLKIFIPLVLICLLFTPTSVLASDPQTLGDLRKIYQDYLAEKNANDNKTAAAKADIAQKEAAIEQANQDLQVAAHEEEVTQEKIEESNARIEELSEEAKKVLVYMQQMQGNNAYVEYVSGATSMTEMIMRYEAVQQITDYIQETIGNLEKEIEANEKLKIELAEKQETLKKQVASYEQTIKEQTNNLESYDAFADSIEDKVKNSKANLDDYVKLCQANLGKTDDSVKLSDCTKIPTNNGWLKPLYSGVITSTIGTRWGRFHNALDIGGNSEGTKVYSATNGRVSGIVYHSSCGGNRVYIQSNVNGVNYTIFYYHLLNYYVKVGDIVTQDTVIGTVGGWSTATSNGGYDSCTTGAHLHYGVAKGLYTNHTTNVMTPPGFPNQTGYRFTSRLDYYR